MSLNNKLRGFSSSIPNNSGVSTAYPLLTRVAGVSFDGRQELISILTKDSPVSLVREKDNKFDKNAISVEVVDWGGKLKIGYIPKSVNSILAKDMDNGLKFVAKITSIIGIDKVGVFIRVDTEV